MKLYMHALGSLEANCYIVCGEDDHCAVIDPGAQPQKLIAFLTEKKLTPACILLTHAHWDHIGGVKKLVETFGCPVAIGQKDAAQLTDPEKNLAWMFGGKAEELPLPPDRTLTEGDTVAAGTLEFTVLETPGHTSGGVCYRCEDALFTGDTFFAQGGIGRTDLPGGSFSQLRESLQKIGALLDNPNVFPGHGASSTLVREQVQNSYMGSLSDDDFY